MSIVRPVLYDAYAAYCRVEGLPVQPKKHCYARVSKLGFAEYKDGVLKFRGLELSLEFANKLLGKALPDLKLRP